MDTIGFLELSSIAGGIEIADEMLKTGHVELLSAKASCPGKYYILIAGKVSDVENSVQKGVSLGRGFTVGSLVLPRVHPQVIQAINQSVMPEKTAAIGVMEFFSVTSSIMAADTAVKSANVQIMDMRLGTGLCGKSFVVITGDTASVESAVASAVRQQVDSGMIVNTTVVPNPRKELLASLF